LIYFDNGDNAFISAYRHYPDAGNEFDVIVKYFAAPVLGGKTLILTRPYSGNR
jgi:uracil phosphoribosyltransferase